MKPLWITGLSLAACITLAPAKAQTASRSALVIGLSQYAASSGAPALEGVPHDMESAKRITQAMGIPANQIRVIQDQEATKANILEEIRKLGDRTSEGGRTFIYFSGHGTRYWDPSVNGCVEGLLTHDGQAITNAELAKATQKVTEGADKVITMIDACHSGGIASKRASTRSLAGIEFKPKFTYKASSAADVCSQPSNIKTRSLLGEATRLGALQENVVQITSSRPDEVSFDEPGKGGLATQGIRDCLLGKATDTDGSGAVSLAEIQQCAQAMIEQKLQGAKDLTPHHVSVSGNRNLIPVQRPQPSPAAALAPPAPTVVAAATPPASNKPVNTVSPSSLQTVRPELSKPTQTVAPAPAPAVVVASPATPAAVASPIPASSPAAQKPPAVVTPAPTVATVAAPAPVTPPVPVEPMLASLATLRDIQQQSNPRMAVEVKLSKSVLKIGKDALEMSVKSSHDGYIYMVLLGSDRKSFYVLYPNGLDRDNQIKAGQTRKLPRPDWQLEASGPPGEDHLLVMVTSSPRKIDRLEMTEPDAKNPFTFALNEIGGRAALINFLVHNKDGEGSERFGAKLLTLKEVP
jgi:hypothetical protein